MAAPRKPRNRPIARRACPSRAPLYTLASGNRDCVMAITKAKAKRARQRVRKPAAKAKSKPAKSAAARWPKQRFQVSHLREKDFDQGLRPYSAYRDLGLAPATGGKVQAHVIRMTKPFD